MSSASLELEKHLYKTIYTSKLKYTEITNKFSYSWMVDTSKEQDDFLSSISTDGIRFFKFSGMSAFYVSNDSVIEETLTTMYIGIPVITLIVFLVFWDIQATLYVCTMMVLTDVHLIGLCYWLQIDLDFFLGFCILLALGLTVDFNIHITHRALDIVPNMEIEDMWARRVDHTSRVVSSIGGSVFQGSFSTLLCVFPGAITQPLEVTRNLFAKLSIIFGFGMFQGLVVLPCLLTLFPVIYF